MTGGYITWTVRGLSLCVVLATISTPARAESFNFETTPTGFFQGSLVVSDGSLTLTITPEGFPNGFIVVQNSSVALLGARSVIGSQTNPLQVNQFSPIRFTFDNPVDSITFAFGDAGGDSDTPVTIQAFNSSNVLLGTLIDTYPAGFSAGKTISGNFNAASYFTLTSGTPGNNKDSIFWEIPSVTPSAIQAVPVPGSIVLAFMGITSLLGYRRFGRLDRARCSCG